MLKKIIVIVLFLALLCFSFSLVFKTKSNLPVVIEESETAAVEEQNLPDTLFAFSAADLNENCVSDEAMFCAVETAGKCTLNPEFASCAKANLPKFIFMSDSSLDRPTEMSYKIIDKKSLSNDTVEIYTESNCNGGWLGLCQGTIIYVLAPKPENQWYVKEIYAIE
ncbi:MAG: hypothetical protein IJ824_03490 [Alphaproteobacteria bacterium]|nr:hypothetical protein [Alphaproteobacteria bacterium]